MTWTREDSAGLNIFHSTREMPGYFIVKIFNKNCIYIRITTYKEQVLSSLYDILSHM